MGPKKYSQLQIKILMFYRDYLKFASTRPEVMTYSLLLSHLLALEIPVEGLRKASNRKEQRRAEKELHSHRASPSNGIEQAYHVQASEHTEH